MKPTGQGGHKHVPQRMCVVCRNKHSKREMTRMVYQETGIVIDRTGKQSGRGAYVCGRTECWERLIATSVLEKALRVSLSDEDRHRIQQAQPVL